MVIRELEPADYDFISPALDAWWGGRPVRALLPRLFFEHFTTTSAVIEQGGELCAFLVGFRSVSRPHVGYIHFVGVAPACRGRGLGRTLYEWFFARVAALGCTDVECVTSPVNTGSIAFHRRMGFEITGATGIVDGVGVRLDHAGPGEHRVLFRRAIVNDAQG